METRFFMPPESSEGNFRPSSSTERIFRACMTFFLDLLLVARAVLARVEREVVVDAQRVEEGARLEDEGDADMLAGLLEGRVVPSIGHRPGGRRSRPTMWRRSTLLPEPLGPIRTKISPGSTLKVTFLST
jgi:hypothetical protein